MSKKNTGLVSVEPAMIEELKEKKKKKDSKVNRMRRQYIKQRIGIANSKAVKVVFAFCRSSICAVESSRIEPGEKIGESSSFLSP